MRRFLHETFTSIGGPLVAPARLRLAAWLHLFAGVSMIVLPTVAIHARYATTPGTVAARTVAALWFALMGVYLAANLAIVVAARARPRLARALTHVSMFGAVTGLFMSIHGFGTLVSPALALAVLLIAVYRVFLDYWLGLATTLVAAATFLVLAGGELLGWLEPHPHFPGAAHPVYSERWGGFLMLQAVETSFFLTFFIVNHGVNQAVKLHRYITESVLRRYLPPSLVERASRGELRLDGEPERRVVTVMFTDLVGFTSLSEQLGAEAVGRVINRYLSTVTAIAHAHGAIVDKFMGDAVMVVFGAPDELSPEEQARRCTALARDIHANAAAAVDEVQLRVRTGINTGEVVVGHFGSPERSDFTVIGPAVNVAARLEGRSQPGRILLGEETARLLSGSVALEPAGELTLKGVSAPVRAFFLADLAGAPEHAGADAVDRLIHT